MNRHLRIKSLRVKAFRGIGQEQTLDLAQKHLLLVGDNGTGKSSFAQAIELALTGKVGNLTGTQRVSVARHSTHVKFADKDRVTELQLTDGQSDYSVVPGQDFSGAPQHVQDFLKAAADGTFILRRSKLLEFVDKPDKDRYEALKPFLGLEEFDGFETILKQAADACALSHQQALSSLNEKQRGLRGHFLMSPSDDVTQETIFSKLNDSLVTLGFSEVGGIGDLDGRHLDITARITALGDTEKSIKASKVTGAVTVLASEAVSIETASNLVTAIDVLHKESVKFAQAFDEVVLERGRTWITGRDDAQCPLCEHEIDREAVLSRLRERLQEYQTLIAARTSAAEHASALKERFTSLVSRHTDGYSAWCEAGLDANEWPYSTLSSLVTEVQTLLSRPNWLGDTIELREKCLGFAQIELPTCHAKAANSIATLSPGTLDPMQLKALLSVQAKVHLLKQDLVDLAGLTAKVGFTKSVADRAKALYDGAVSARKSASKKIFKSIEVDLGKIYSSFHPGESLGGISIEVKDAGAGSAIIKADFDKKKGEDPRAFYSEAHQDTLGLATFLALRKRMLALVPSFRLVVLDDVLTSVDGQHRERIANYLLTETVKEHQLVITTHNRQWFEWLVQIQAEKGVRAQFHNARIVDWTLEQGPVLSDITTDHDLIVRDKGKVPAELLIPTVGRFFEGTLCQLRYTLALAVSAKFDERYTIGDIWGKFVSTCKSDYKPLWHSIESECEQLTNTKIIRNWGTHENIWFKDITDAEAMQFIDPILSLYSKVHCLKCGTFIASMPTPRGGVTCKKFCLHYLPQ